MASAARQRSLIVPREHGAWGILLIPLLTGGCVGFLAAGSARNFAPLGIAALSLFWLRTPVESWAGTTPVRVRTAGEMKLVRNAVLILAAVSIGALIWLFWGGRNRALLGIGAIAGTSFLIQAILKRAWQKARTVAQMIGAAGLTSMAPAAYYVATGQWDGNAWSLWAANLLFAVNQIHFVQLRIHAAQIKTAREKLLAGRWFLAGQFISIAMLASACALHLFRWYAAAAFLPILFRGSAWFAATPQPLAIHTLGKSELLYACAFGVLLVLGIRLR